MFEGWHLKDLDSQWGGCLRGCCKFCFRFICHVTFGRDDSTKSVEHAGCSLISESQDRFAFGWRPVDRERKQLEGCLEGTCHCLKALRLRTRLEWHFRGMFCQLCSGHDQHLLMDEQKNQCIPACIPAAYFFWRQPCWSHRQPRSMRASAIPATHGCVYRLRFAPSRCRLDVFADLCCAVVQPNTFQVCQFSLFLVVPLNRGRTWRCSSRATRAKSKVSSNVCA